MNGPVKSTFVSPADLERLREVPAKPVTNSNGLPIKRPVIMPQMRSKP